MANIDKLLKDEFRRLARKECVVATALLRQDNAALKRAIADHKRRLIVLERDNRRLVSAANSQRQSAVQPNSPAVARARITAKMILAIRQRLKVSQTDFARLVVVNPLTVYNWEHKDGRLVFRGDVKAKIIAVRQMTQREVKEQLAALAKAEAAKAKAKRKKRRKKK